MTRLQLSSRIAGVLGALLGAAAIHASSPLPLQDFGPIAEPMEIPPLVRAINHRGQIVGEFFAPEAAHVFTWWTGAFEDLAEAPGSLISTGFSTASDINDHGEIVGSFGDTNGNQFGFVYRNGAWTSLGDLPENAALRINDRGDVLLVSRRQFFGGQEIRTFVWRDGDTEEIPAVAGSSGFRGIDMNVTGEIVGMMDAPYVGDRPFLWTNGELLALVPLPSHRAATVNAINVRAEAVGYSVSSGYTQIRAVLWRSGEPIDLGVLPGDTDSAAVKVDDSGRVLGESWNRTSGSYRAFVWDSGAMIDITSTVTGPLAGGMCPSSLPGPCYFAIDHRGVWGTSATPEPHLVLLRLHE